MGPAGSTCLWGCYPSWRSQPSSHQIHWGEKNIQFSSSQVFSPVKFEMHPVRDPAALPARTASGPGRSPACFREPGLVPASAVSLAWDHTGSLISFRLKHNLEMGSQPVARPSGPLGKCAAPQRGPQGGGPGPTQLPVCTWSAREIPPRRLNPQTLPFPGRWLLPPPDSPESHTSGLLPRKVKYLRPRDLPDAHRGN